MIARSMIAAGALVAMVSATIIANDVDLEGVKCLMNPRASAKAETAVEYNEGSVFFCCNNCKGKFEEEPEKFAVGANRQLVQTEQYVQAKCPISGRDLNPEMTSEVAGQEVTFCCGGCKGKVDDAEGEAKLALVFSAEAFEKGFALADDDDDGE